MIAEDFKWFVKNYDELYKTYGNCFLLIRDKSVVDSFSGAREAQNKAKERFPSGDFIIQQCTGDKTGYTNFIVSNQIPIIPNSSEQRT